MSKEKRSVLQRVKHTLKGAADFLTGELPPEYEAIRRKLRERQKQQQDSQRLQASKVRGAAKEQAPPRSLDAGNVKRAEAEASQGTSVHVSKLGSRTPPENEASHRSPSSTRSSVAGSGSGARRGGERKVALRTTAHEGKPVSALSRTQSTKEHRKLAIADAEFLTSRRRRETHKTSVAPQRQWRHEEIQPVSNKFKRSDSEPHIEREMRRCKSEMSRRPSRGAARYVEDSDLNPSKSTMLMNRLSLMHDFRFFDDANVYNRSSAMAYPEYWDDYYLPSCEHEDVADVDYALEPFGSCTLPRSRSSSFRDDGLLTDSSRVAVRPRRYSMSSKSMEAFRDGLLREPEAESGKIDMRGVGTPTGWSHDRDVLKERFLRQTHTKRRDKSSEARQKSRSSSSVLAREARLARENMEKMIKEADRTLGDGQDYDLLASRMVGAETPFAQENRNCSERLTTTRGKTRGGPAPSGVRPESWTQATRGSSSRRGQVDSGARAARHLSRDVDKERFWASVSTTATRATS